MNCTSICVLLVFVAGTSACWWTNSDPQETHGTPVIRSLSSPTPTPVPLPTITPTLEPTATPTPPPLPTPTPPSEVVVAIKDVKSIAYTANLDISDLFTESDGPVSASLTGWLTTNGDSQIFMQIDLSRPVDRSIEILLFNSFAVYLRDVQEDQWYFIPENSDAGPLGDILSAVLVAHSFAAAPSLEDLKPVQGGYVWKVEDSWGSTTAAYNTEYLLQEFFVMDPSGHELIRVTFFGYNEQYPVLTPEEGELLPEDYWETP